MENTIKFGTTYVIKTHKQHGFLVGRLMVITNTSKKPGYVNGYLYNPKDGQPQKSHIAIPFENLEEVGLPALIPSSKPTGQKVITPEVIYLPGATKSKKVKTKVG